MAYRVLDKITGAVCGCLGEGTRTCDKYKGGFPKVTRVAKIDDAESKHYIVIA